MKRKKNASRMVAISVAGSHPTGFKKRGFE
jgi:hypothetical protein